ncbi:MAG: hypothetical protein L6R38_002870 [Xanthoria sp. 2 TBL-2021]|nr:MAG: hypothetical protein L6R38_002870 [Xanthoria sp. 2 TBL-2021]
MAEVVSTSGLDPVYSTRAKETLTGDLDDLLERYLDLVHRYTSLHQSMAKEFASGFLSLAQANFSNPNRVRYGQDFYDDRMQALTSFYINPSADEPPNDGDVERLLQYAISVTTVQPVSKNPEAKKTVVDEDSTEHSIDNESKPSVSDSLKWFGILVPPAFRASQTSFKSAATETIPLLANLSNEMKSMEIEIRRMRKKIRKLG